MDACGEGNNAEKSIGSETNKWRKDDERSLLIELVYSVHSNRIGNEYLEAIRLLVSNGVTNGTEPNGIRIKIDR
jgi:hypothetical protein